MKIDELIEKLKELRKEHGNLEVILWTQRDACSYDDHTIADIYYDGGESAVIHGDTKTEEYSEPFDNADDFIKDLLE